MTSVPSVLEWASGHGGKRQKLIASAELSGQNSASSGHGRPTSNLSRDLLEAWACQEMSAVTLQRIACSAMKDGLLHDDIKAMASCGTYGKYPNHCSRDLMRHFKVDTMNLPPSSEIVLPAVDPKGDSSKVFETSASVQYPHDVFSHWAHEDTGKFTMLYGDAAAIVDFWHGQDMDDPKLYHHPLLDIPGFETKVIPVKLHSDGVQMAKKQSVHVISVCSFLAKGSALDTHMYFGSAIKSCCCHQAEHGHDTVRVLFRHLAWSLAACLYGEHPVLDWNFEAFAPGSLRAQKAGTPLTPSGFRLAVL
eukprot:15439591-Alexandrium_andersonii.AAC.1